MRALLHRAQSFLGTPGGTRAWILGYHLVEGATGLSIDLPMVLFLDHLRLLRETVEVTPLSKLTQEVVSGASESNRIKVVLTFDDAFRNFYEVILPLLREVNVPATLFVPPGFINGDGNHPLYHARFQHLRPMTWEHILESTEAGIEIGSHTYQHTNLVRLSNAEVTKELVRSQQEIEKHVGIRPTCVCYPEGFANRAVFDEAARFYEYGVVGGGRAIRASRTEEMLKLPRLPIRADMSAEDLSRVLKQSVYLEEWVADKVRRLRGRITRRGYLGGESEEASV